MRIRLTSQAAFTLLEALFSAVVALIALGAILVSCLINIRLADMASLRVVYQATTARFVEELQGMTFDALWVVAANPAQHQAGVVGDPAFTPPPGATGELLVTYATNTYGANGQFVTVTLDPMWRDGPHAMIGEDQNLDGVLDAGEDRNSIPGLDSPFRSVVRIAKRSGS